MSQQLFEDAVTSLQFIIGNNCPPQVTAFAASILPVFHEPTWADQLSTLSEQEKLQLVLLAMFLALESQPLTAADCPILSHQLNQIALDKISEGERTAAREQLGIALFLARFPQLSQLGLASTQGTLFQDFFHTSAVINFGVLALGGMSLAVIGSLMFNLPMTLIGVGMVLSAGLVMLVSHISLTGAMFVESVSKNAPARLEVQLDENSYAQIYDPRFFASDGPSLQSFLDAKKNLADIAPACLPS